MTVETREPGGIKPKSLIPRVATGVGYGVVVLGSLALGPLATGAAFGIMAGFAAAEFYALERREQRLPNEVFGVLAATAMPVAAALWGLPGLSAVVTALIAASLLWHMTFRSVMTADTAETVFGAVYTGFLLAYLVMVRDLSQGLVLSLALVLSVWVADMAAFFVGSLIGRHKLAPSISPNKSWEGFIAGVLGCVAIWAIVPFVPDSTVPLPLALITGFAVALASVVGDLTESRIKREAGVKDSGTMLPGHGGFLDRLDSLIFACLVAFWVLWWGGVR